MKIGVFDSGIGGKSVMEAIAHAMPTVEVLFKNDSAHMPYGDKSIDQIYQLCLPILRQLEADGCQVIVVACNTVTTNLIGRLRAELAVPLVGIEPMIKPAAAMTKSGVVAVCATPRTLQSERYAWLKQQYAEGIQVLEPDCSRWSYMIEQNAVESGDIEATIGSVLAAGADVIVLGCTHYHWIFDQIQALAAHKATVIQPEYAVVAQLKRVIEQSKAE